eukprot:TRINITY_DN10693_c0_g2_i1.p1 TRINITY_DN10693_c0_g2~~TRINITY_DN10693_c0_g2_i1.p1  ORF type:complete len:307 (-),score=62.10 TRINITY_DN10693_c0_g2_i1:775-1593(-)
MGLFGWSFGSRMAAELPAYSPALRQETNQIGSRSPRLSVTSSGSRFGQRETGDDLRDAVGVNSPRPRRVLLRQKTVRLDGPQFQLESRSALTRSTDELVPEDAGVTEYLYRVIEARHNELAEHRPRTPGRTPPPRRLQDSIDRPTTPTKQLQSQSEGGCAAFLLPEKVNIRLSLFAWYLKDLDEPRSKRMLQMTLDALKKNGGAERRALDWTPPFSAPSTLQRSYDDVRKVPAVASVDFTAIDFTVQDETISVAASLGLADEELGEEDWFVV